jgi:hypothetical protein
MRIFIAINIASKSFPVHPAHCMNGTKWKTLINIPKIQEEYLVALAKKLGTTGPLAGT